MANDNHDIQSSPGTLSEEDRAIAFASALTGADRAAAMRTGRTPVPPKFVMWMIVAFVVLGLGGGVVEHYFGNIGVSTTTTTAFRLQTTPTTPSGTQLASSLSAFIGLKEIGNARAAPFTLHDQAHRKWSIVGARGKVVVLTFYNANCNDVCPVLGAEIRQTQALLGSAAGKVEFVIVNSDPNHFEFNATPRALSVPRLLTTPSVHFLTGPLPQLNAIWINYGLSVKVGVKASEVAHNNILYFIDAKGNLRAQAVPFGDENTMGVFSLGASDIHRFAVGIARTADSLVR